MSWLKTQVSHFALRPSVFRAWEHGLSPADQGLSGEDSGLGVRGVCLHHGLLHSPSPGRRFEE